RANEPGRGVVLPRPEAGRGANQRLRRILEGRQGRGVMMRVLPRTVRGTWALAAAAWLAGCAAVWWALPVRPRAEWKVPAEDCLMELFAENLTAVTFGGANGPHYTGPLRLWDSTTGRVRELLPADDRLSHPVFSRDGRWLAF